MHMTDSRHAACRHAGSCGYGGIRSWVRRDPGPEESLPIGLEVGGTFDMALRARCLRVAGEALGVFESYDVRMRDKPGLLRITPRVVTAVTLRASLRFLGLPVAERTAAVVVGEGCNRVIALQPADRMWQLDAVACRAEGLLRVACGARFTAVLARHVRVGDQPRLLDRTSGMVARIAIRTGDGSRSGPMTHRTARFALIDEFRCMSVFQPPVGVRHLGAVA